MSQSPVTISSTPRPQSDDDLRDIEQDVIKRFSIKLNNLALERNITAYAGSPLGAQDTVFADYLLASTTRFCLIEFKATKDNFSSENQKALRVELFKVLANRKAVLRRSLDVHYMCWGTFESDCLPGMSTQVQEESEMLGQYAPCVAPYMKAKPKLEKSEEYPPESFAEHFFESQQFGSDLKRFKRYVRDLSELAADTKQGEGTIEGAVCIYIEAIRKFKSYRFKGLEQLLEFLNSPNQALSPQKPDRSRKPNTLGM
ncbi:hypothetical protein RA263_27055 [Pseudomonas syringae pv. tagetis]|uniref:Uncharacterized protein n=1 Tax=Pseudomonas syringae pv. tagetis TaxID=129140 RepID=A0A0Q0BIJ8_9PSED|nr:MULTISPECIES: hypothetical protein [Pseudomonas syringae group]KPY89788.1 Uncharacterized protein ALO44_00771 [Pseudomonas syringae pv. tagetis]MCH5514648.1 hypothetical protein [Pseudomonas syringae pv. syringae]RMU79851.1 hypothetical protein ALP22_00286 [Pseudomonas coronafaciens pv. porri]RMW11517.1 hypothetical protein ALO98_00180 [Pseudomonas syringae pv. tagetis]RMW22938.1 hypothetical protein ALO97_04521 [Pseudomonas syringae pv. tagetis]